jgi:tetratricopeptide (TPR) repeat protein
MTTSSKITASLLLVTFTCTLALGRPALAADAPIDEARVRFQRGVQLFHEGSYEAALAEFRKAYQVAPSFRLLYNIGQVHYELHDYVGALKSFRQYLTDGADGVPADRRALVDAELKKLEGLVAYLEITTSPEGSDVLIDDVPVGIAPLGGPVLVNPGQRRVGAGKDGRSAPVRTVTLAGGDRLHVVLQVPEPLPLAPMAYATPRSRERVGDQVGVWLGVAATGMLALAAGGFAFATQQAKRNFDRELEVFPTSRDRIEHFRNRMTTMAAVTDGLAAGALVAAGLTLYLAIGRRSAEDPGRRVAVRLAPGGVSVGGGF